MKGKNWKTNILDRKKLGTKELERKRKKNLLRSVRLNLVLAGGIACDEQDGKGMIANDERERKKGSRKKGDRDF